MASTKVTKEELARLEGKFDEENRFLRKLVDKVAELCARKLDGIVEVVNRNNEAHKGEVARLQRMIEGVGGRAQVMLGEEMRRESGFRRHENARILRALGVIRRQLGLEIQTLRRNTNVVAIAASRVEDDFVRTLVAQTHGVTKEEMKHSLDGNVAALWLANDALANQQEGREHAGGDGQRNAVVPPVHRKQQRECVRPRLL